MGMKTNKTGSGYIGSFPRSPPFYECLHSETDIKWGGGLTDETLEGPRGV